MKHAPLLVALAAILCPQARAYGDFARTQVNAVASRTQGEALPASAAAFRAALDLASALRASDPLVQELRLQRLLLALRSQPPEPGLRARVEELAGARPLAWTSGPDPDHARWLRTPVADIGATARGTLRQWDIDAAVTRYAGFLSKGDFAALAGADPEPLALAVARSGDGVIDALLAAPEEWPAVVLAAVAERRPTTVAYHRLFAAPPAVATYQALARVTDRLAPAEAVQVLVEASAVHGLASAAVLALRPLAHRADVQRFLLAQLGDADRGGSAAQLLGEPQARVDRGALQALLDGGQDDAATRRAIFVFQQLGDPDARARLRQVASDTRYPAALRAKVSGSLR